VRRALVAFAVLGALVVAVAAWSRPSHDAATIAQPTLTGPPRALAIYAHIRSLTRRGPRYELRFDPAWWLGGTTANRAAVEDGVIPPGDIVPNDYYVREESRRLLTYRVPLTARATVVTAGPRSTSIAVAELAEIVKGRNPRGRRLLVPGNRLGFWIRVRLDTVRSLDQQYQP
jgi:hypothetical protein